MTFEYKDLIVGVHDDHVVVANDTTTIRLTEDQARWLVWAGIPAALMQLEQPTNVDNSDAT